MEVPQSRLMGDPALPGRGGLPPPPRSPQQVMRDVRQPPSSSPGDVVVTGSSVGAAAIRDQPGMYSLLHLLYFPG